MSHTDFSEGRSEAEPIKASDLLPMVYDELRRLAATKMAWEKPGHSLNATALVHEALRKLEHANPRVAQLISLRRFAGLNLAECAEVLGISARTADTWWAYGRAWLAVELGQ